MTSKPDKIEVLDRTVVLLGIVYLFVAFGTHGTAFLPDISHGLDLDFDDDNLSTTSELLDYSTDPFNPDTDSDGLIDGREVSIGTSPTNNDTDNDSLTDFKETKISSSPLEKDTDKDGVNDGKEVKIGTTPSKKDSDSDGLDDGEELETGTDPLNEDTDRDNLTDSRELELGINPKRKDTDNDGLEDGEEIKRGTEPAKTDTDNDGVEDGKEVEKGLDPKDDDTDSDGLEDGQEIEEGTDPLDPDSDSDGLEDGEEMEVGTDPLKSDTDEDLLDDGRETELATDPLNPDTDGDKLIDGVEKRIETSPLISDTDEDKIPDGAELSESAPYPDADPQKHDIYVEVDWMEGCDPEDYGLDELKEVFEKRGYKLHIVESNELAARDRIDPETIKEIARDNFDNNNKGYHYAIASRDVYSDGDSVGGVALYDRPYFAFEPCGSEYSQDDWVEKSGRSTFAHELGHSLGLGSGVFEGIDSEKISFDSYRSVMNYNAPFDYVEFSPGEPFDDWQKLEDEMVIPPIINLDYKVDSQRVLREYE
ncbi:MAG: hypothetical protein H8Z69_04390 [Nanohaloarchaea archaeon]|nr:hypothetical protein [Candidatus Nanohaloarchaea archaeon]